MAAAGISSSEKVFKVHLAASPDASNISNGQHENKNVICMVWQRVYPNITVWNMRTVMCITIVYMYCSSSAYMNTNSLKMSGDKQAHMDCVHMFCLCVCM